MGSAPRRADQAPRRRWRGKSQVELAGLAGLSPSFLSMVETGQRPLDRRSHIAALASALKVSETDLVGGPHLTPDPLQSDPHMGIPALRVALQTNTFTAPAVDRARSLAELAHVVTDKIEPSRRHATTGQLVNYCPTCSMSCTTTLPRPRTKLLNAWRCKASSKPACAPRSPRRT